MKVYNKLIGNSLAIALAEVLKALDKIIKPTTKGETGPFWM